MMQAGGSPPPLRFDGAVVDGPLPRDIEGRTRLLSQTLSAAAAAEQAAALAQWRAELKGDAKTPVLRLLSPLPADSATDVDAVLKSARSFLKLQSGKARRTASHVTSRDAWAEGALRSLWWLSLRDRLPCPSPFLAGCVVVRAAGGPARPRRGGGVRGGRR
jgi:hypothetical protein